VSKRKTDEVMGDDCLWHPDYREALDQISDIVLKYRPKAKSRPAVQRKRRKTILEKKRATEKEK
jgi:hypothetical protein